MKGPSALLPHLALLLTQASLFQAGPSLLDACVELSIGRIDGVLSGKCNGARSTMLTSVDLDQCLGWGPRAAQLGLHGETMGLAPVENGAFTDHCFPCYIVNGDEYSQGVAHLLCNCGPDDSDISTEYSVDLGSLVTVTNEGCLECMGATSSCIREVSSRTSRGASAESNLGQGSFGWLGLEGKRVPCQDSIIDPNLSALLPRTYQNTTHHRCRQDNALCCYQTPARYSRTNTWFEAFNLIEGDNEIWRLHFVIDKDSLQITGQLRNVVQFCSPGGMEDCEGETPLDAVPDLPDNDNGKNFLENSGQIVFDDDEWA